MPIPTAFVDHDAMKITSTHARANLRALWDKIERTRRPVTIRRRGHADMVLLPAADFDRLHDHLRAMILALRRRYDDPHPSSVRDELAALLKRIAALASGVPIDHNEAQSGITTTFDAQVERMQEPEVWAKTKRGFEANLEQGPPKATRRPRRRPRRKEKE